MTTAEFHNHLYELFGLDDDKKRDLGLTKYSAWVLLGLNTGPKSIETLIADTMDYYKTLDKFNEFIEFSERIDFPRTHVQRCSLYQSYLMPVSECMTYDNTPEYPSFGPAWNKFLPSENRLVI